MHIGMHRYMIWGCVFLIFACVLMWTIDVVKDGLTLGSTAFWALMIVELFGMLLLVKKTMKQKERLLTKIQSPISCWLLFAIVVTASVGSRYFLYAYSEPKDTTGFARSALIATAQWCFLFFIFHYGRLNSQDISPPTG